MDADNSAKILGKIQQVLSDEKVTECFSVLYLISKYYELKLSEINPKITIQLKETLMKKENFDNFVKMIDKDVIVENKEE